MVEEKHLYFWKGEKGSDLTCNVYLEKDSNISKLTMNPSEEKNQPIAYLYYKTSVWLTDFCSL